MAEPAFNPSLIRLILVILFLLMAQLLRLRKTAKTIRPMPKTKPETVVQTETVVDEFRDALKQASEKARAQRQGNVPVAGFQPMLIRDQVQQPPKVEPESPLLPSLLLIALVVCLCLMAYRYWTG